MKKHKIMRKQYVANCFKEQGPIDLSFIGSTVECAGVHYYMLSRLFEGVRLSGVMLGWDQGPNLL